MYLCAGNVAKEGDNDGLDLDDDARLPAVPAGDDLDVVASLKVLLELVVAEFVRILQQKVSSR